MASVMKKVQMPPKRWNVISIRVCNRYLHAAKSNHGKHVTTISQIFRLITSVICNMMSEAKMRTTMHTAC